MADYDDPITPGAYLQHEFLTPLGISQSQLARDIDVPVTRINGIINGTRAITADTALRFGAYFHTSPEMWLNLQNHVDLQKAENAGWEDIAARIRPAPRQDDARI